MAGLAEQWFRIADEDKDGKIAGGEAVRFFMRSGLPKDVLGQVRCWTPRPAGGLDRGAASRRRGRPPCRPPGSGRRPGGAPTAQGGRRAAAQRCARAAAAPASHARTPRAPPTPQIWELASGGAPALTQLQFNTSMRLVALAQVRLDALHTPRRFPRTAAASIVPSSSRSPSSRPFHPVVTRAPPGPPTQVNMGRLPPDQARAVAMGGGPQVPLPRMAGLDAPPPPAPGAPGYTVQVTGAVPPGYNPQVTGAYVGYAPQMTGASVGYSPQVTGGGPPRPGFPPPGPSGFAPRPGMPPAPRYAPQATGGWAPVSAEDMSRYKAQFSQLDRDGDGLVQVGGLREMRVGRGGVLSAD